MSDEDAAFFEQMLTCRDAYRRLADCILDQLPDDIHTAYDIGCGVGFVVERLREQGIHAAGCDTVMARAHAPASVVLYLDAFDLRGVTVVLPQSDLVICTETAEHLEEYYGDHLVRLCVSGKPRIIVWSAAQPGQEWPGHVNLQAPEYWLRKFEPLGYYDHAQRTARLRVMMATLDAQHVHAANNFHVLTPIAHSFVVKP